MIYQDQIINLINIESQLKISQCKWVTILEHNAEDYVHELVQPTNQ